MPWGDGTGPLGLGPMTGRRAGYCAGFPVPGYMNPGPYWGRGFGRGRGWRRMYYATGLPGWARFGVYNYAPPVQPVYKDEKEFLKEQAKYLKEELDEIAKRLKELEKEE